MASSKSSELSEKRIDDIENDVAKSADEFSPEFEKKTMRSIDRRILSLFALIYAVSVIDRTNLGLARIAGMEKDLELKVGDRYSIVSCLFFVPYILLQLPSNLILRKVGPRNWLTVCVLGWGAAQLGMGFVPNWRYLTLCRIFLGFFEAGLLPAEVFVIATWYKRHEVQTRLAGFYLLSIFVGGFSTIFGYALTLIAPRGGLNGWQWIFVIEGAITVVVGFVTYLFFPEFPDQNRFLTPEQTKMVLARVEKDRGDAMPDQMTWAKLGLHLSDWTIWATAFMMLGATIPTYTISYFSPVILTSMGYSSRDSMLMTCPPIVTATFFAFGFAWVSDRTRKRAIPIAIASLISIMGLFLLAYGPNNGSRYAGIFFISIGAYVNVPGILSYNSNNVLSHSKRSVSTAIIIAFAGIAGIFATTIFRQKDYPRYLNGMWITIGCQFLLLILLAMTSLTFMRRNRLAREGKIEALEGRPGFYYTI